MKLHFTKLIKNSYVNENMIFISNLETPSYIVYVVELSLNQNTPFTRKKSLIMKNQVIISNYSCHIEFTFDKKQ